jgi:hypothetical protein
MAHNAEAGDNGGSALWSLQLTYDEANVMYRQRIPVSLQFKPPHGWHMSNAGYTAPPTPAGPEAHTLIAERWVHTSPTDKSQPSNAPTSPTWPRRFEEERAVFGQPRCRSFQPRRPAAWWQGHDVVATLVEYGYRPRVPALLPPGAVHGTRGISSTEAAGKNHVGPIALWLVKRRWTHLLGRASFRASRRRTLVPQHHLRR